MLIINRVISASLALCGIMPAFGPGSGLASAAVADTFPARPIRLILLFAPGGIMYPSAGTGNSTYLAGELFAAMAGVTLTHVPYKGASIALTHILSGELHKIMHSPEIVKQLARVGIDSVTSTPAEFHAFIKMETEMRSITFSL